MVNTRAALERLWTGRCTVYIQHKHTNPDTKRTEFAEAMLFQDQPCRLSYKTITSAGDDGNAATVSQAAILFLAPELTVPAGSKIFVAQNGRTCEYSASGQPAVHSNHQEIPLALFKGWA